MRKYFRISIALIIIASCIFVYKKVQQSTQSNSTVTPTAETTHPIVTTPTNTNAFCTAADILALIAFDHAAGNVYGKATLQNISSRSCQLMLNNFIEPIYDKNSSHIVVHHIGQSSVSLLSLLPQQILYSQLHYPNGPQCQTIGITMTPVTFSYQISPTETITFKDQSGNVKQMLATCKGTDTTEIQIWNISLQPITP